MGDQSKILRAAAGAICAMFLLVAEQATAQFESGNLYGSATTTTSEELAGVALTLSGVGPDRRAVSDEKGQFRFLGLAPGTYELEAEFGNYAPLLYESVVILVGRTTSIQLRMSVIPSEVLVVSTEPPLLDYRNFSPGIIVSRIELDVIPTSRDPWSVADQAPGVLIAGVNIGGNEAGQQPAFVGPGARHEENAFAIDGVVITDMAAAGYSPTYYDYDQFEEVEVTLGGPDASVANSGVTINMLTRRGSNDARGSARTLWTDQGLQSSTHLNRNDYPFDQDEILVDRFTSLGELGVEGGGPLIRDRLWGWGSYGHTDVRSRSIIDTPDRTRLEARAAKLNARPYSQTSLVAMVAANDKTRDGRGAGPDRAPETLWRQSGPFRLFKIEGTQVISSGFYFSALFSVVDLEFGLSPAGGSSADAVLDADGVWRGGFLDVQVERDSELWKLEGASLFDASRSSHELSFGLSRRRFDSSSLESWGSRQLIHIAAENVDNELDLIEALRVGRSRVIQEYSALWLQDSWKVDRRTIALGLRYDFQRGRTPALIVDENPVFPALLPRLEVPDHEPAFDWRTLSPRLGISYRLDKEGHNVLRASYSRFSSQLHSEIVARESPQYGANALFEFEDLNGNGVFDGDETADLLSTSGVDPDDPAALVSPHVTDPDFEPEITDEILVGLHHEVQPDLVLGLDLSLRRVENVLESRPLIRDAGGAVRTARRDDYLEDQIYSGATPDGVEFSAPVYSLSPGLEYTGGRLLTNGDREQIYRGATLSMTKRLTDRWMMRGQLTVSDWRWRIGPQFQLFDDPTDLVSSAGPESGVDAADSNGDIVAQQVQPFGDNEGLFLNSSWSFSVTGAYRVALLRPWGFVLAGQISGRQGFPLPYFVSVKPNDGLIRGVQVTSKSDTFRHDDLYLLDLRLEKELSSGSLSTTFSLDAFNLLNSSTVLQRSRKLNGPQALFVRETLSPRVLRLGLRFAWQ